MTEKEFMAEEKEWAYDLTRVIKADLEYYGDEYIASMARETMFQRCECGLCYGCACVKWWRENNLTAM